METYNIEIKGQQQHISANNFNEENLTATTVINILNKYADDNCKPLWNGDSFELNNDYYMTITTNT